MHSTSGPLDQLTNAFWHYPMAYIFSYFILFWDMIRCDIKGVHDMHSAPDPLDLFTNAFWHYQMVHIFSYFIFFLLFDLTSKINILFIFNPKNTIVFAKISFYFSLSDDYFSRILFLIFLFFYKYWLFSLILIDFK